jgi:ribonucleoside-diphosphate reductase alpha chain
MNAVSSEGGASSMTTKTVDAFLSVGHVEPASDMKFCAIDNPDCEACQ